MNQAAEQPCSPDITGLCETVGNNKFSSLGFHLTTAMWDKWFFGRKNEDLLSNLHFSFAVISFAA